MFELRHPRKGGHSPGPLIAVFNSEPPALVCLSMYNKAGIPVCLYNAYGSLLYRDLTRSLSFVGDVPDWASRLMSGDVVSVRVQDSIPE